MHWIRKNVWKEPVQPFLQRRYFELAEVYLVKSAQQRSFQDEISSLIKQGRSAKNSQLLQLNSVCDEKGILRVGGRIGK